MRKCKACGLSEPEVEFVQKLRCVSCVKRRVAARRAAANFPWPSLIPYGPPVPPPLQPIANFRAHGLTRSEHDLIALRQEYGCAICHTYPSTRLLDVDHDHNCCPGPKSCGRCVRGFLCNGCNTAIGRANDDPRRLRSAADYLEAYKASVALDQEALVLFRQFNWGMPPLAPVEP